jgi:hypothetical protein
VLENPDAIIFCKPRRFCVLTVKFFWC